MLCLLIIVGVIHHDPLGGTVDRVVRRLLGIDVRDRHAGGVLALTPDFGHEHFPFSPIVMLS
jgi:hypothetical protein